MMCLLRRQTAFPDALKSLEDEGELLDEGMVGAVVFRSDAGVIAETAGGAINSVGVTSTRVEMVVRLWKEAEMVSDTLGACESD